MKKFSALLVLLIALFIPLGCACDNNKDNGKNNNDNVNTYTISFDFYNSSMDVRATGIVETENIYTDSQYFYKASFDDNYVYVESNVDLTTAQPENTNISLNFYLGGFSEVTALKLNDVAQDIVKVDQVDYFTVALQFSLSQNSTVSLEGYFDFFM